MDESQIEIYRGIEGEVIFDVDADKGTIWATQEQISKLFGVDRTVITRHLRNIYKDGELKEEGTCAKNARVGFEGERKVVREVKSYNLDAIISVGYRVNSKKATDFRIWATGILKKYVTDGVVVDMRKFQNLDGALAVVKRLMMRSELEAGEMGGILEVISKYADSFRVVKEFDEGHISFRKAGMMRRGISELDFENLVDGLREQEGEGKNFGAFVGAKAEKEFFLNLANLEKENGKSVGEKAVELLYEIVKDRPFLDGNRRIGALLFIYFLTVNDCHLAEDGETKISDRALTAIVLLIAESREEEKDLILAVVTRLIYA